MLYIQSPLNTFISKILQCIRKISHNAPLCNRHAHVQFLFQKWCIVGYGTGALWDDATGLFNLTHNGWLKVNEDSSGHVLSTSGLREEGVEGIVTPADGFVAGHLTVRLNAVLQTVELPAGIAHLHASLANMDADALTLKGKYNHV